ncbi:MAG: T9SS type A sorting domain-containing protein [Bacteroidales bacterium]|nr:T9SS type A sorting domain-containing protein [Bacteroidales bacterium]
MKKNHVLLSILLFFTIASSSQTVLFQKFYNLSEEDEANDIIATSDGNFFIAGKTKNSEGIENILIIKVDDLGDTIWTKTYCGDSVSDARKIIQTSDGNYLIAGGLMGKALLLKINIEGDSLWSMTFPNEYEEGFKEMIELPNSDIILIKWIYLLPISSRLIKIDSIGNIDWSIDGSCKEFHDLHLISDNEFLLSGWEGDVFYPNVFLRKYDFAGNLIFNKQFFEFQGQNKCMDISGQNVLLGCGREANVGGYQSVVIKTDFQGNAEEWFDLTNIPTWMVEALVIDDNDHIITCSPSFVWEKYYVNGLNQTGNIIGSIELEITPAWGDIGIIDINEFLYVTGNAYNNTNGKDIFLVKINLDSLVSTNTEEYIIAAKSINIYPNPANDIIYIDLQYDMVDENTAVIIRNITGSKVERTINQRSSIIKIPVNDLNNGVYFLSISMSDQPVITEKIIIVH